MLSWDVIVLNGYLALNFYITTYLLFTKFRGRTPDRKKYVPFVFLAIGWAVSIHTVTAFLYSGMGARPHWNAAILAPRFLASAFAAGPSLMIIALSDDPRPHGLPGQGRGAQPAAADRRRDDAHQPVLLLLGDLHRALQLQGPRGVDALPALRAPRATRKLVPYIWARDRARRLRGRRVHHAAALPERRTCCASACAAAVVGVWVEKGMGLVIPGFVPSPLGEIVDYTPSFTEFCVSAGIWASGALIYTLLLKAAVPIELGTLRDVGARDLAGRAACPRGRSP